MSCDAGPGIGSACLRSGTGNPPPVGLTGDLDHELADAFGDIRTTGIAGDSSAAVDLS